MSNYLNKIYFPNLNGLRFIAAFMVIIHHIEQIKGILGLKSLWENPCINILGPLGVVLFFVLSGFLITYLLLVENKSFSKINVKNFYIRRILRIWPLYYLILALSFFVFPQINFFAISNLNELLSQDFGIKLTLFVFFLPNISLLLYSPVPYGSQLWSVGIEEQFYLFWPLLFKVKKNIKSIIMIILLIFVIIRIVLLPVFDTIVNSENSNLIHVFFEHFNIDCMAIGAFFSVLLFEKNKILSFLYGQFFQVIILISTLFLIVKGYKFAFLTNQIYALLFAIIILNLSSNKKNILNLENRMFNYLGKISYGLYMYHVIAIVIITKLFVYFKYDNFILICFFSIMLSILLASLSYELFEKKIIKLKLKYTSIISGDNVKLK